MDREGVRRNPGVLAAVARHIGLAVALGLGGCSASNVRMPQSIQGLAPSGTVTLTETVSFLNVVHHEVKGTGGGSGTLNFNGRTYPFQLTGSVMGSGGAKSLTLSGQVYGLSNASDFEGHYTQGSGSAGLSQGWQGHLWLQNHAGVVMYLYSTDGNLLSIGEDEIIVRLSN